MPASSRAGVRRPPELPMDLRDRHAVPSTWATVVRDVPIGRDPSDPRRPTCGEVVGAPMSGVRRAVPQQVRRVAWRRWRADDGRDPGGGAADQLRGWQDPLADRPVPPGVRRARGRARRCRGGAGRPDDQPRHGPHGGRRHRGPHPVARAGLAARPRRGLRHGHQGERRSCCPDRDGRSQRGPRATRAAPRRPHGPRWTDQADDGRRVDRPGRASRADHAPTGSARPRHRYRRVDRCRHREPSARRNRVRSLSGPSGRLHRGPVRRGCGPSDRTARLRQQARHRDRRCRPRRCPHCRPCARCRPGRGDHRRRLVASPGTGGLPGQAARPSPACARSPSVPTSQGSPPPCWHVATRSSRSSPPLDIVRQLLDS